MEFEVEKIPNSKTILIPVANENLKGVKFVTDISVIKYKDKTYKVFDYFLQEKEELHQRALFQVALGVDINKDSLWKAYPKSNKIFLFVCKELDTEKEIKNEVISKDEKQVVKVEKQLAPKLDL